MRRSTVVYATGVLAVAGLMTASQPAASSSINHWMLATGRAGHTVTATIKAPDITLGTTSQMLIVGVPGSTGEIADPAALPATAVMRSGNQLDSTPGFGETTLSVTFAPPHKGVYPVFRMSSDAPMCHSARMDDMPNSTALDQVGVVDVT